MKLLILEQSVGACQTSYRTKLWYKADRKQKYHQVLEVKELELQKHRAPAFPFNCHGLLSDSVAVNLDWSADEEEEEAGEEAEEDADGSEHEGQAVVDGQLEPGTHNRALVVYIETHHSQHLHPQHKHHHHNQQEQTWKNKREEVR